MTEKFIRKSIEVHGDKYDYSKTDYIKSSEKVIIICKEHGEFLQIPNNHLRGAECKLCSLKKISLKRTYTNEMFIKKAKEKHGDKYDYSKVIFTKAKQKVIIICRIHGEFQQTPDNHCQGKGCELCATVIRSSKQTYTKEMFIQKAIETHGNKYDYSKTEYIKSNQKVVIICKIHGDFMQTPQCHLSGAGCIKCSGTLQKTKDEFIKEVFEIYGNNIDCSNSNYINNHTKLIIHCNIHNIDFPKHPRILLSGSGCPECSGNYHILTTDLFIKKAIEKHGDKYDYYKVDYKCAIENVIITCKKHGDFEQTPNSHLSGAGCRKCGNVYKPTTNEFIKTATEKHGDKYDYSKVDYKGADKKVIIICKEHGEFLQRPACHNLGMGCRKCISRHSKSQIKWLDFISSYNKIQIQHAENKGEYIIPNTRYSADGYCEETNTIYEFHGDFWHGNPKKYNPIDMNIVTKKTYGELYQNTIEREKQIKDLGYNLVVIWESDWSKINKSIKTIQNIFRLFKK
jgi:hypothetical protein